MAVLAIRLADSANGVSELHGDVSRKMWHNIWPQRSAGRSADQARHQRHSHPLLARAGHACSCSTAISANKWMTDPTDQIVWEGVMQIPDEELWRAHERCRERLVGWTRQTLKEQLITPRRELR